MALFTALVDDFQTGTVDTGKWTSQLNATVTGGQLRLAGRTAYLRSAPIYGIAGSSIYARILVNPATIGAGGSLEFNVHTSSTNYVGFRINADGTGRIKSVTAGSTATGGTFTYSSGSFTTAYLWVRIRHDGTAFAIDAGNDLTSAYTTFTVTTPGWNPTATMYANIELDSPGAAGVVLVDNINTNASQGTSTPVLPGGASDLDTLADIAAYNITSAPAGITDTDTLAAPFVDQPNRLWPTNTTDPDTVSGADLAMLPSPFPTTITDTDQVGGPRLTGMGVAPTGTADPDKVGQAAGSITAPATYGAGEYSWGTYNGTVNQIRPVGIGDAEAVMGTIPGQPGGGIIGGTIGTAYGSGTYSDGTYNYGAATSITPDTVRDTETLYADTSHPAGAGYGSGDYGTGIYSGDANAANIIAPATVWEAELVYGADYGDAYGSGTYGMRAYQQRNIGGAPTGYGSGTYGAGTYPGGTTTPGGAATPPPAAVPVTRVVPNPLHVLGIGPWNPIKVWHGAANYGIGRGIAPAKPILQLPGIQSKSVTLRLTGGDEATVTCQFARSDAVIVREMATDLWWLRKDPRTGRLDMLGRFNCSHNDLSRTDEGLVSSSLQFQDWSVVLGARMVLKYKDTKNSESQWDKGTPVTEIMKFAVPTDMGIDVSILDKEDVLGATTQPFTLPPYNTIEQTFEALKAISPKPWEWWIDTTTDYAYPPKLQVALQRGEDKGVTLFDFGTGPSPIASWQMRATSDNYANTVYFQGASASGTGAGGGVIRAIASEVDEVGERDVQISDNSITDKTDADGKPALLFAAADKALTPLADRRPTFTVVLQPWFWRGRDHIDVGDTIRLRIRLGRENITYNYRVTEMQIDIDEAGAEQVTLTLGNPLPSSNPRSRHSPVFKLVRTLRNYVPPPGKAATS